LADQVGLHGAKGHAVAGEIAHDVVAIGGKSDATDRVAVVPHARVPPLVDVEGRARLWRRVRQTIAIQGPGGTALRGDVLRGSLGGARRVITPAGEGMIEAQIVPDFMSEYPDVLLPDPLAVRRPAGDYSGVVKARHGDKIRLPTGPHGEREAVTGGGASRPVAKKHHQLARMA